MPGLGSMVILLVVKLASWALKLLGEGANTIYWGEVFQSLIKHL